MIQTLNSITSWMSVAQARIHPLSPGQYTPRNAQDFKGFADVGGN